MDKFALGFVKWIVLPAAIGAFGYFVVGPKIGKSETESVSASTKAGIEPTIPEATPVEEPIVPLATKTSTEASTTTPKTVGSKFDPDVPQGDSSSKSNIGVNADHDAGTDAVDVERAAKPVSRPKPRRRPTPVATSKPDKTDDGVVIFGADKPKPKAKPTNSDSGPGDDIKKMKPKEHKDKKDDPNLPATPEEPKDGGGGTGGGTGN